ncbi:MAG: hypothetical protein ACOYVK_11045 [Bacillota bacterium]
MLEELNNILDRTNNWIVFEEARNSGLIALNLGLLSFIFGSGLWLKEVLLSLCILSMLISTYSFLGKRIYIPIGKKILKPKEPVQAEDDTNKLLSKSEEKERNENHTLFSDSRVVVKRRQTVETFSKKELYKYAARNIYNYKDVAEIDEETLLQLVYHRLLMRNENEEYPIHISKDYHFKLAHRDLSKMIYQNSVVCAMKAKCFLVSLLLFILNLVIMGIIFLFF